jgi:hypothetical protein
MPAAPIHATLRFVAFFVPHVVVYASSQDFVETALGQPHLNKKGPFLPALYPIVSNICPASSLLSARKDLWRTPTAIIIVFDISPI